MNYETILACIKYIQIKDILSLLIKKGDDLTLDKDKEHFPIKGIIREITEDNKIKYIDGKESYCLTRRENGGQSFSLERTNMKSFHNHLIRFFSLLKNQITIQLESAFGRNERINFSVDNYLYVENGKYYINLFHLSLFRKKLIRRRVMVFAILLFSVTLTEKSHTCSRKQNILEI